MWAGLLFGVMIGAVVLFCGYIIMRQQRTIDRLTDKIMARDYTDYKRHTAPMMREEPRIRKPQSWHDDPSVVVEDEVQ